MSPARRIVAGERGRSGHDDRARRPCTPTEEHALAEQPHRDAPPADERSRSAGTSVEPGGAPSEPGPPPRRRRTGLLLTLAAVVLLADIGTKVAVVATIRQGENIRTLGGLLYLTHLRNVGAAFSFAQGATILFTVIAVAVVVVIVRTSRRLRSALWATALGLVLGGALGNLVDRIFRSPGFLRGGVVDFLSVFAPDGRVWPVFNVADSAIVCGGILGAVLAVIGLEFDGSRTRDRQQRDGTDDDGAPRP